MNRTEKRLLTRTIELGLLLTLLVILADGIGLLAPLESYLYDLRARHCQFFTPSPSKKIVHLDINDESLKEIGWFPWPRTKLAMMLDEVRLAGAKIIGFDIIFPEPQPPRFEMQPDGTPKLIHDDQNFADAVRRAGNVLIPLSVPPKTNDEPPITEAMASILRDDVEQTAAQVTAKLRGTKFDDGPPLEAEVREQFLKSRERAMFDRVWPLVLAGESDPEKLKQTLIPKAFATGVRTDVDWLVDSTLPRVLSVRRLSEFSLPMTADMPQLLRSDTELATIAPFCEAAAYSGFVDFAPGSDGVVRMVPLFVNHRGRLLPHMSLVMACAMLDVKPSELTIAPDTVTIPIHGAGAQPLRIPVRSIKSQVFGDVGLFMNIPWFGKRTWETMYDAPRYADSAQHIPLQSVWRICAMEQSIHGNDRAATQVLAYFVDKQQGDKAAVQAWVKQAPTMTTDALEKMIRDMLADDTLKQYYDAYKGMSPQDRGQDGETYISSYDAMGKILASNARLRGLHASLRDELHKQLEGCAVFIGWAAIGNTDFYPTSLHPRIPGVAIQSVVVNGILTRELWTSSSWWVAAFWTLVLGVLTTLIVAFLPTYPALFSTILLACGYLALNGIVFFDWGNRIVGAAAPITAATIIWFGVTAARYLIEQRERSRITKRFSSYVDPVLVNFVVENPERARFDGQVKEMTVCFTDLAGFTTISEKLRERTVPMLNEYMSLMLPIIRSNKGYWNKFLGDGIMFFYNAPADNEHHARDAVFTVLQMQGAMEEFNKRLFSRGLPHVAMRAGISTGMMVVGDAGSTDPAHGASDYTVLGDEVNLGARLESANKALGSRVLMSGRTAQLIGTEFLIRPVGKLQVVGKTEGVETFEAVCMYDEATEKQKTLVQLSADVVAHFKAATFDACIQAARVLEETCGSSKFTQLYMRLSRHYLQAPPNGFDGQIVLEEK
ncbi:MAG TPA: adenylate/guanylate cyclase domain-containing protein [Tepidisphaeraceae bacterium]